MSISWTETLSEQVAQATLTAYRALTEPYAGQPSAVEEALLAAQAAGDAYGAYCAQVPDAETIQARSCVNCGRLLGEGEAQVSCRSLGAPVCWACRRPEEGEDDA